MSAVEDFGRYLGECPLIAIIRGVTPAEAVGIASAIFNAGVRIIEVPLNSPDPLSSIRNISDALGERALIGAGTVLTPDDARRVRDSGGRLVVSPNMEPEVIRATVEAGMVSCPGTFTPTEAITALGAGAHALKFFPGDAGSPAVIRAIKTILPRKVPVVVTGGVTLDNVMRWLEGGADGAGLGSGLYKPGQDVTATAERARAFVDAARAAR